MVGDAAGRTHATAGADAPMSNLHAPPPVAPVYAPAVAQRAPGAADPRLAAAVSDLTRRLRPVCAHLEDGAFERLVLQIAHVKLRWAEREAPPGG
jgi:hypothetical protein